MRGARSCRVRPIIWRIERQAPEALGYIAQGYRAIKLRVTEAMRIAGMAYARKLSFNPHTSATGINMASTIFADHIKAEIQKWAKVVKEANIQPE